MSQACGKYWDGCACQDCEEFMEARTRALRLGWKLDGPAISWFRALAHRIGTWLLAF